jgi:hypothetical protein
MKSIPTTQQSLNMNGKKLNEMLRLKDQGLTHRGVLVLVTNDSRDSSTLENHTKLPSIALEIDDSEEKSPEATAYGCPSLPSVSKKKGKEGRHVIDQSRTLRVR